MLPTAHIEFTWTGLNLFQRRLGLFEEADYRLVALAALAPDLLDKPLALTAYRDANAALFWGHNLWLHAAVWAGALALGGLARGPGGQAASRAGRLRTDPKLLPYLLGFSGHLIADRMWGFRESLLYPLGAGFWHPWVHVGRAEAMLDAYLEIIRTTPLLVAFELAGAGLLGWFIWDRRLFERPRFRRFLRSGRPDEPLRDGPLSRDQARGRPRRLASHRTASPVGRWLATWLLR